jgi:hypothetical protein
MVVLTRRAAGVMLTMAALGATSGALAQAPGLQTVPRSPGAGAYISYGPVCNRAGIRDCQAQAQFQMRLCDAFPGRLACADRVLAEQSACFATTGCD